MSKHPYSALHNISLTKDIVIKIPGANCDMFIFNQYMSSHG